MYDNHQVCAVIPARNEAAAIGGVVTALKDAAIVDRIIVCDNGSHDATAAIARGLGAETVTETRAGYGAACLRAISRIRHCDIVVFVDADASLQLDEMPALLDAIVAGADLAIGIRVRAWRERGSMAFAQRLGNRAVSGLIQLIWRRPVSDLGPFRAIRFDRLLQLRLRDRRFGWNVEMQIRAIQHRLTCVEIPVHYRRRIGHSKISGTPTGVALAGFDMIGTILRLALKFS
jgi:glycosyltransferase involved in cell wall biosynthesis